MAILIPIFLYGTVIVGLIIYGKFVYSRRHMYKCAETIPGFPQLPFIGNAHQFTGNTGDIMEKLKYFLSCHGEDGISKTWLGPKLFIGLTHPPSIEIVLNEALDKADEYKFLKPWVGDGLISGEVNIWRKHRKMLLPTFNQKVLNGYMNIFVDQSNVLVEKLSAEVGKGQFDVFKYITSCTMDIVCETTMGVKVNAQRDMNQSYIKAGIAELDIAYQRMFQIWLKPQWIFNLSPFAKAEKNYLKILHGFTEAIVQQKRVEFANRNNKHDDSKIKASLELMIELNEDDKKFSDQELREEVDTMVIAGNDTSALGNGFILMMLGCFPEAQEKVVEELREIFGDSNRPVCKEDLAKMQYLERVMKETMRLLPVAPIFARHLTKDVKLEKYTLPAGAACVIGMYGVHRDKKIWGENAEEFEPDRFLPENSVNRHPYAFLPFSGGVRDCIGKNYAMMSMKVIISTILRSYKIHSNVDYKTMRLKTAMVMRPIDGHLISIERRNKF